MITISACMIVKNEEAVLERCLNSFSDIVDEIIMIDTGSTDRTKEIAARYTDKIYDFTWIDDFAAARDYSFSKAEKDYIYVADADEVIDDENRRRFRMLKQNLIPQIEVVQMAYTNQLEHGSVYNFDEELRPKLYKRLRTFHWVDQIHETVEALPVVYDSDIKIIHMQEENHAGRDFKTFQRIIANGSRLSAKLVDMYARELFIAGKEEDFLQAHNFFLSVAEEEERTLDEVIVSQCVLAKSSRLNGEMYQFLKNTVKGVANDSPASELCYELGEFYYEHQDYKEAVIWYYNAVYESASLLNMHYSGDYPLKRLAECYEYLGNTEQSETFKKLTAEWKPV